MPEVWGDDEEAERAWQNELQHRLDSISDGTALLIDGETVFQEVREHLARNRAK
jgi:hypothetical protein